MKYIRTKDGVYSTLHLTLKMLEIYSNEIISQADTIEELVDLFVYDNEIFEEIEEGIDDDEIAVLTKPLSRVAGYYGQGIGKYQLEKGNVYGAIWTKWGLKYVAKMNEDGDLELI